MNMHPVPEPKLKQLYQEVILDHYSRPRNYKSLASPTAYSHAHNPLCGDDYHLYLCVDRNGQIEDIGFQGSGCAISKASASIMTTLVKGRSKEEVSTLAQNFLKLMTNPEANDTLRQSVGPMKIFEGVKEFPIRVKCATLIWHALEDALQDVCKDAKDTKADGSSDKE